MFLKKQVAFLFFMGLSLGGNASARAADKADIYVEAAGGLHLKHSSQGLTEFNVGYLIFDGVGVGLLYDQFLATAPSAKSFEGAALGAELRFFLEPVEVVASSGLHVQEGSNYVYIHSAINYLFALTPALALKTEVRGSFIFKKHGVGATFWLLGGRLLF